MTTDKPHRTARGVHSPTGIVLRTALLTSLTLLVLALVALLVTGAPGALGALVGGAVALVVFASGAVALGFMTRLDASIALMAALVTYSGQAIVVVGFFLLLARSGAVGEDLSRGWLAAGVVGVALAWSALHVLVAGRARMPLFDLPEKGADR